MARYWCFLPLQFSFIHEIEERNVVTCKTILAQTARRSQQSYIFTQQLQRNVIFKARYCICSSRTRCWIESIASTLRFYLFIYFCFQWLSLGTERRRKIWGLSKFQRSAVLTSRGNTSLPTPCAPVAPARAQARRLRKGSDAFLKVIYAKQNKWRSVAELLACKVRLLNGGIRD